MKTPVRSWENLHELRRSSNELATLKIKAGATKGHNNPFYVLGKLFSGSSMIQTANKTKHI